MWGGGGPGGGGLPGLGRRFGGGRSLRCFSRTCGWKEASKSTITVLINHMAAVLTQIDARVVIKAQTSKRQGETSRRFSLRPPLSAAASASAKSPKRKMCKIDSRYCSKKI